MTRWAENVPSFFYIFLCFNVHLPAKILSGFDIEVCLFLHAVVSGDSEEISKKQNSWLTAMKDFTFIFPNAKS